MKRGGWKDARHVFETYGHDIAADDGTDVLTGTKEMEHGPKPRLRSGDNRK